ncbi:hypothetical protein FGO68_gene12667 [Halteria grandinella]|uniref:Uncharacterized protein n=1 Tax=Halteria grandinella TaxID=5974 RepID=A0A8J8NTQ3_HALGN|nr:hypothetical protein FGO68_gene12667 [Halteria grandinella]
MIGISQLNSRMTPSLSVAQTHQNSSPYTLKKPLLTKQISTTRAQILRNSSQTILDSASRFMAPPNIVTSRQSNYRQQSSRGQTLNNSIDYSQNTGSRLMHDQRDMFIRTMDQQNMRLISHIQMVEREIGEYRANVGRYYTMSDPSNNQLIVEERQEELNELVHNVNEVLEVRRELKRGIRKAKMLLEKQESRENVGDIKNRVKEIVLQVKALKRELKFKRSQRDERQGLIDKQAEQLGKVHNLEKLLQKIQKFRMKHKRLEQTVKEKNSGDKQSHVSFIDKIIQQKKLKDQLYQVQRSPKYLNQSKHSSEISVQNRPHITMRDLSLNNRQQYLIRVSQTLEKKKHHLNNSIERAINAQVERLQGKELEIQEVQVLIKAKERENLKLKQEIEDLKRFLPEIYEEHSPINKSPKIVITEVPKKPQVPRFRKPLNQYQTSQQNEDLQNLLSEEDHHFDSSRFSSYSAHIEPTTLAVDQTRSFLKARRSSRDRASANLPEQSFFLTQDDPAHIERLQESPLPVYIKPKLKYQVSEDLVINESLADLTQTDQNIEIRRNAKRLDDEERSVNENQSEEGNKEEESISQPRNESQVI